jgi:hypothetical protein
MSALPPRPTEPSRPRRLRLPGALLAAALLVPAAPTPASAQARGPSGPATPSIGFDLDTAYAEAVVRLDIENGPSEVVSALVYNSTLLLPLRQFLEMAEIRLAVFALRDSAVAVLEPGSVPLRFDPRSRVLSLGAANVPYDTADVVWWDGDLFVATALLDRLLGVTTSVEWADLSVVVGRSAGLPVIQRARRERRRQLLGRAPSAPFEVLEIPLRERTIDGAVLSWSVTAATGGPTDQLAANFGFGTGLLGGSAELRPQLWRSAGAAGTELRASWTRVWPTSRGLQQLRVGDVQSSGLQARLLEGLVVTNAPFIRSSQFDIEPFAGTVLPGWEVELYDGGRLLAYGDADAVGAFRVPLQLRYGQNPFELVLYGPSGETVRQKRTIRVPFSRLPAGRFEYALAAGRCQFDPCRGLMSADARYGLSTHVTLQGGWEAFFRGQGGTAVWQPYAVVSAAPFPALGVTGEAVVNGRLRAAAEFEPTTDLRVTGGLTRYAASGGLFSGSVSETSRAEASLFWRPGWMGGAMFFQGTGARSAGPSLQRSVERLAATTRVGLVRYSLGVLLDELRSGSTATRHLSFDASADASLLGPWRWLRTATAQGQLAVDPAVGLTALRTTVGRRVASALRVDAGIGWFRGTGVSLELNVSTALPGPRAGVRSRVSSAAGSQALTFAYGSMAWDPRSQLVRLGDGADLGRAGISGVLFRDDDGNGRRDAHEPGLAGIPVTVGGWPATTDANGRFTVWGLVPSEPVQVDVDTLSFGDPHLILPAPLIQVRPSPNAFGTIALPVVVGAEVSGFVVLGERALGGVPVLLRELNTGAEITILTFADGGFYRGAVPPGDYEVTLPDAVLDRLNAYAPPLNIFIPPGAGEKRYEDLQLRLEPRP